MAAQGSSRQLGGYQRPAVRLTPLKSKKDCRCGRQPGKRLSGQMARAGVMLSLAQDFPEQHGLTTTHISHWRSSYVIFSGESRSRTVQSIPAHPSATHTELPFDRTNEQSVNYCTRA